MEILKTTLILALFLASVTAFGCGPQPGANSSNANSATANTVPEDPKAAKTNQEELALLINVPYDLDDLVWKDNAARKTLIAVMRVTPADAAKIVAEAEKSGTPHDVSIPTQTWFPDELIAQGETSGDSELKGQAYPANAFFQEPYTSGRLTRIENTDYFILELAAK